MTVYFEDRKEDRIYLRTDEANPDTIESAHVSVTMHETNRKCNVR